jgi:translation initiation factor 3 subunit C
LKNNNKQYKDLINKYRENPESYGEDSDKEYDSHDDIIDADPSITWDTVNKKFKWLVAVRGRKKTGRFEQFDHILPTNQNWLKHLHKSCKFFLVWFLLSLMLILIGGHMTINVWKKMCAEYVGRSRYSCAVSKHKC